MSSRPVVPLSEIPAETRAALGLPDPPRDRDGRRRAGLTKDEVRSAAIRVLNVIAQLSPSQRRRVLDHARKLNDV